VSAGRLTVRDLDRCIRERQERFSDVDGPPMRPEHAWLLLALVAGSDLAVVIFALLLCGWWPA